mmetsp:Transcript_26718/g.58933  ORF Transcript_26718/g.58933 Transcript_26718/m.58933 type:complete len:89 (-) Transcript_26718:304-570(-)
MPSIFGEPRPSSSGPQADEEQSILETVGETVLDTEGEDAVVVEQVPIGGQGVSGAETLHVPRAEQEPGAEPATATTTTSRSDTVITGE